MWTVKSVKVTEQGPGDEGDEDADTDSDADATEQTYREGTRVCAVSKVRIRQIVSLLYIVLWPLGEGEGGREEAYIYNYHHQDYNYIYGNYCIACVSFIPTWCVSEG